MNKKALFMIGLVLILSLMIGKVWATGEEAAVSQMLSERGQRLVDGVFGKGQFVVIADVSMTDPRYEVRYTRQSQAAVTAQKSSGEKMQILPGYPVIRNLSPDNFKQLPFDSVTNYSRSVVRQIRVTLVASQDFPKNQLSRVQALVSQILDLNPNRDRISVVVQRFSDNSALANAGAGASKQPQNADASSENTQHKGLQVPQSLSSWILIFLAATFVVIYAVLQIRSQKLITEASKPGETSGDSGQNNINVSPNFEMPKSTTDSSRSELRLSQNDIKRYFDFINDETVEKLLFILQRENVAVENLAVLIPCLTPKLAAKVMAALDIKTQALVAMSMVEPKMYSKTLIEKFETQLKSAMECLIGGEDVADNIFSSISGESKKQLLNMLKGNPEGFKKVRSHVVIFDDLGLLEDDEMRYLLNAVNRDLISAALANVDPALYQKFDQCMTKSQRDMVREYIELRGQSIPVSDVAKAQESVLDTALKLDAQGRLKLREKINLPA